MRSNSAGQRNYYEAIDFVKSATAADQIGNVQSAITSYTLAISRSRSALRGKLNEVERKSAQELIDRASNRIQELQTCTISNPPPIHQKQTLAKPARAHSQLHYQKSQPIPQQSYKVPQYQNYRQPQPQQQQQQQQQENFQMDSAILQERPNIKFSDVAGLEAAKQALNEAVILPIKMPKLFQGPTQPWKGILLYGPPGTGKSFLAKAVAGEANNSTFLTVSTAELTSKWVGESEKLIKSLFETARQNRPSIIFIDEIDSLVSTRGDNESESGRRIKTEFLIQMDGVSSNNTGVLLIAATNLPWALDPAMRRRFEKRIYVPLPDNEARLGMLQIKLKDASHSLSNQDIRELAQSTDGFSGADISILVRDALMQPIRELQQSKYFVQRNGVDMNGVTRDGLWVPCTKLTRGARSCTYDELPPDDIMRPVASIKHFRKSIMKVRPSVSKSDLKQYEKWTSEYGEDGI